MVAQHMGVTYDVLSIHLEAQYLSTIEHIEYLRRNMKCIREFYWVCLPISLRNAVSVFEPLWTCWDPNKKDKWICEIPEGAITLDNNIFDFYEYNMGFNEFTSLFGKWYVENHKGSCSQGIGIRSDENEVNFMTLTNNLKDTYKNKQWTTQLKINGKSEELFKFYPLYDWKASDIWTAVSKFDWEYNQAYEMLYKNNISINDQRLCQFFGDVPRRSLDQIKFIEPETWERCLDRLAGINFGNIYARTSILGNLKSEKPEHMSWQEYAIFLLESIGFETPELRDHYIEKIQTFFNWYKKTEGLEIVDIPETAEKKLETKKKVPSWRRIARAIEKNDFWMTLLSFGETKKGRKLLDKLKEK
ncbi:DUF3440 domain-containing protein [Methanosphaera cuniculi]|uniref:DUF3440 domain-containing protein n=1 Tax=Methanosphaera cuniculi TaxID=1077256 RepID=UPI0026EB7BD0|nr:DUF3440 domain-containing protein [Methanosphaera cuniculi]